MSSFVKDVIMPKNWKISKNQEGECMNSQKKTIQFYFLMGDDVDHVSIQMSTSIEGMALHLVHALMMWLNHELIT
jgi:hypothetical protein